MCAPLPKTIHEAKTLHENSADRVTSGADATRGDTEASDAAPMPIADPTRPDQARPDQARPDQNSPSDPAPRLTGSWPGATYMTIASGAAHGCDAD